MTSTITEKPKRLLSLDVFRGITIAAMILVNDPGDWGHIYAPLEHSKWNGCTPTDLVFPFFLFMVGVSVIYAMESKKATVSHSKLILKALRRTVILLLIPWATQLILSPRWRAGPFAFAGRVAAHCIGIFYQHGTLSKNITKNTRLDFCSCAYWLFHYHDLYPGTGNRLC
jgi:predicted acyltransferase